MVIKKENVSDKQVKLYIRGRDVDNDAFVIEMRIADGQRWEL